MGKIYIGIDNGVSGSIAILKDEESIFLKTPVFKQLSYQKTKKTNINRLDFMAVHALFSEHIKGDISYAVIERPMVNNTRIKSTISAVRCLEATLILLEMFEIPYQYIDSKPWQKEFLPGGTLGSEALKAASKDVGIRLFPEHSELIRKHKDADSLLMAKYAQRFNL